MAQRPTLSELTQSLKRLDRNHDGQLARGETFRTEIPAENAAGLLFTNLLKRIRDESKVPAAFVLDDRAVFTPSILQQQLGSLYPHLREQLPAIIATAFPKGVENISLSQTCDEAPHLSCNSLPRGKVLVNVRPGKPV